MVIIAEAGTFEVGEDGIDGVVGGKESAFTVSFVVAHETLSRVIARNWTLRGFGIDRRIC